MYIYNQYYVGAFICCGVTEAVSHGNLIQILIVTQRGKYFSTQINGITFSGRWVLRDPRTLIKILTCKEHALQECKFRKV